MAKLTAELSKRVGHAPRDVAWPRIEEVAVASDEQLLIWLRFLPCSRTPEQLEVINAVFSEFQPESVVSPA